MLNGIKQMIAIHMAAGMLISGCGMAAVTGGPLLPERLRDGTFEGTAGSWPNRAKVRVTVLDGRVSRIDLLSHFSSWVGNRAEETVPARIIERQSTDVDAVTGATNSSRVIMNAVQAAVEQASSR
ncbi:MAG TPA: FMN-binding protein [Nitrospirota bacterium]|nr:FMN-binding protein [Nitrospirota bacterium]